MSVYMGNNKGASGRRGEEQQANAWFNSYNKSRDVKVYANEADKQRIKTEIFNNVSAEIGSSNIRQLKVAILRVAAVLALISSVGLLIYRSNGVQHQVNIAWNTFEATGKNPRSVLLADSSTVVLKPGAKIAIPSNFNKTGRMAKLLTGEAFFEVKRNPKKPFIVQSGELSIKVLGTAFTVRDDKKLNRRQVAVAHGKVEVSNRLGVLSLLTKGRRIKYLNATGRFSLDSVAASRVGMWSQSQVELNHVSFTELAETFEAVYGKELVARDGRIMESRFTLSIDGQQQAYTTLRIIAKTHGLYFEEQDEKVTLTYQK